MSSLVSKSRIIWNVAAFGAVVIAAAVTAPVYAADLGGNCCADLEERIAELEATTARKGNRKVSLTVSGHLNEAVLFWDDGTESNAYVVGNTNDESQFTFSGDAEIGNGWSAGYELTLFARADFSEDVSQDNDDSADNGLQVWSSHWWIESKRLGKVYVGLAPRATDGTPEVDLSEASVVGYAGAQDLVASFRLRPGGGALSDVAFGDLVDHFNSDTAKIVRYDTPEIAGFIFSASYGEDDIWDVGLTYSTEVSGFKFEAAIGYNEVKDTDGAFADVENDTILGSASLLHVASGLNLTFAAGERDFNDPAISDAKFYYAKLGWLAELSTLGPTAFYGEFGRYSDFGTAITDPVVLATLNGATVITGSEVDVWGFGVVQHIEAAEMQLYLGYRNYSADVDADVAVDVDDLDIVTSGAKIAF